MKYPRRSQYKYAKFPYRIRNWPEYEAGQPDEIATPHAGQAKRPRGQSAFRSRISPMLLFVLREYLRVDLDTPARLVRRLNEPVVQARHPDHEVPP